MLLFSTDYPHHQFDDAAEAVPAGLSDAALARLLGTNAFETYQIGER